MKGSSSLAVIASLLCFAAPVSLAKADGESAPEAKPKAAQPDSIPNSDNNYLDDRLLWATKVAARKNPNDPNPSYCFPPWTRLLGHKSTLDSGADSKQYLQVILDPSWVPGLHLESPYIYYPAQPGIDNNAGTQGQWKKPTSCPNTSSSSKFEDFEPGDVAYVSSDDLAGLDVRAGIDYGALAVPFKAQMTGKRSFSGSVSLGGYIGYRMPWKETGLVFSPIVFVGASNISNSVTVNGATSSETLAGLSYGAGIITRIKNSGFQVGLIVGFDHVDSAQPYEYNDKPWLSLEVGYSFAQ